MAGAGVFVNLKNSRDESSSRHDSRKTLGVPSSDFPYWELYVGVYTARIYEYLSVLYFDTFQYTSDQRRRIYIVYGSQLNFLMFIWEMY